MLQNIISVIAKFIKTQKMNSLKMILCFLVLFFLSAFYLFPFNDLSDFATAQIYKNTNKSIYAQFDNLEINLMPLPSVEADDLKVESRQFPTLKASHISLTPSLIGLINKTPSIDKLVLEGFLSSTTTFKMSNTEISKKGALKTGLHLNIEDLDLSKLPELVSIPYGISPKGTLNADITSTIDTGFSDPPEGEFLIKSQKISLPSFNLALQAFSILIPDLRFSKLSLKGRLIDEKLNIEELTLGNSKDSLFLKIKGETGLKIKKIGRSVKPVLSNYKLRIDLQITKELENDLYFLGFLDSMKTRDPSRGKSRFLFKLAAKDTYSVPQPSKLSNF